MSEIATALRAPFDEETVRSLHAGDRVLLGEYWFKDIRLNPVFAENLFSEATLRRK